MGQYYRIFICEEDGSSPRVYDPSQHNTYYKLMEHSYYGNEFVGAALSQLSKGSLRVWWVGDYAKEDDISEEKQEFKPVTRSWDDAYLKVNNKEFEFDAQLYLINLDTHEYIDLKVVMEQNKIPRWGGSIHPLPLLTVVGNSRGGDDYCSSSATNKDMVGAWAGDLLQVVDTIPHDDYFPYIEINTNVYFSE